MDKLRMHSVNKVDENVEKIAKLFPNCVTEAKVEGKLTKVVDFDILKQELSSFVVEGMEERYQFTWPDKKKSILLANAPIAKTLRPCKEESVDFDNTENLYIEGDNLDVLKLLQETYLGKIKMIYIDPPYNTGNDFVYEDDFAQSTDEYLENSGQYDENGNRLVQNTESNGRYHTDWLNMMYPRLRIARDMLKDDGVIFVSIDDGEVSNLRKVCDEVFGEMNFVADIIWQKKFSRANDAAYFSTMHDHVLCYAKNHIKNSDNGWVLGLLPRNDEIPIGYSNPDNDERGVWTSVILSAKSGTNKLVYDIITPSGRICTPPSGRYWSVNKEKFDELVRDNRIWFGRDGNGVPRLKTFLSQVQDGLRPNTIWFHHEVGHNQEGKQELKRLFDGIGVFDSPKPIRLIEQIIAVANLDNNALILDFFSGSATTAHAVMKLNAEDGGNRRFIMVQLPEETEEPSEAYKAGYKNICEIGKERIRRAGAKIKEEAGIAAQNLDTGFRVLKLDSTNMKDVYYSPDNYNETFFDKLTDNIKEDRTPLDLLFQVMLELDVLLSSKIEESEIAGKNVFSVMDDYLIACFDDGITSEVIEAIAKKHPYYAVFRDSCMADDSTLTSFEQIFETYSKDTIRKVL